MIPLSQRIENISNAKFQRRFTEEDNMENTTHVVSPSGNPTHTIIFLHGRDSIASEFALEVFESQASDDRTLPEIFPTVKWVFPASKLRNSERFGTEMSQWFDMWSVENPAEREEIQTDGLRESVEEILSIIRSEASLISPERIILGGISQGCETAILALLYGGIRLGGFIGLSSWLPLQSDIETIAKTPEKGDALQQIRAKLQTAKESKAPVDLSDLSGTSALDTPVFLAHSKDDDVVPISNGRVLCKTLEKLGLRVSWKAYVDGGHWVNEPQGVDDITAFLQERMRTTI
jgi:lysophospholipase-2